MPVKTQSHKRKNYPKHYTKVYWPYLPLVIIMVSTIWLGSSLVNRSQRGVLAYATNVTNPGLLQSTNMARQENGDVALTLNSSLSTAAQAKANDMVKKNYWSHVTPSGKTPWSFIDATGYKYGSAGENLAYGFASSSEVINGWMNSPAHRENLLNPTYQTVGFGVANSENYEHEGPETVVVALYANPLGSAGTNASSGGQTLAFTTSSPITSQPASSVVDRAQTLTQGRMPWISFTLGLALGAGAVYLCLKNSLNWRRSRKRGERFHIEHPLRDVTMVAGIVLCIMLLQSAGTIR